MVKIAPLSTRSEYRFLPLWRHVVFVDWYGVMSHDQFWKSILANNQHAFHRRLTKTFRTLFNEKQDLVSNWMTGKIHSQQLIQELDLPLTKRHSKDYWYRTLLRDCRRMQCDSILLQELIATARAGVLLVLATDNMDCFYHSVDSIEGISRVFDAVLCSSSIGFLKSENPERFFGDWLRANGFDPSQAFLLDDSTSNCLAFQQMGGTAGKVDSQEGAAAIVRDWRLKIAPLKP